MLCPPKQLTAAGTLGLVSPTLGFAANLLRTGCKTGEGQSGGEEPSPILGLGAARRRKHLPEPCVLGQHLPAHADHHTRGINMRHSLHCAAAMHSCLPPPREQQTLAEPPAGEGPSAQPWFCK